MPKRTSPQLIKDANDLNNLDKIIIDKRKDKRASDKKERRDRHYSKVLIKVALKDNKLDADE
jgi:hypothetical protein